MQKQFLQKATVLILIFTTLFVFISKAQFYELKKNKWISVSYTPDTAYNYWFKIKTPDTLYYLVFDRPFYVDTIIKDSVVYMVNSCGTASGFGIMVIFLKPKLKWFYVCGVFDKDYKRGLFLKNNCYGEFKRICVYSVKHRKIVFYRTILDSVPKNVMCEPSPLACLDTIYLKNGYLYFRPNLKWKDYFKPQYRQSKTFAFRLAH